MKKILNALFLTLLAVFTFSSCSDVPAPYDILGEGDVPGLTGGGTKEDPYNIETAQKKQDGSIAWVQGYIVGCVDGEGKAIATESKFEAPFTIASNILIADTPNETNYKNCIPVQLVGGSDVRTALNLKDNAGNLGKVVMIYGSLEKYFGVAGLKSATAAVLDGVEIGEGGSEQPSGSLIELLDATNPVNQVVNTFDEAEKDKDYLKEGYVNFAEVGGRTWRGKPHEGNGLIQATAYGSKQPSVISWFVTPAVNVAQMEVKKVTFDCISAYYKEGTKLEVYFLEKNGNELNQTLLNVGTLPQDADGYSEPVTLTGDLTAIGDKVGFIGFKYIGSEAASGTYQIDNLYVGVEATENPEPSPGPEPEENSVFVETFGETVKTNTNVADFTGWDNKNLKFEVANSKCNIRAKAHMTDANRTEQTKVNSIWFPAGNDHSFTISGIDASKYSKFIVKYELGANVFNQGTSIDLNVLKVLLNDVEVTAASKVVSNDNKDANVFFDMQVEIDVQGTANSTLKFSATGADNTMGLLLYNVRLIGVTGDSEEPGLGEADGTEEYPYSVADVIAFNSTKKGPYYVKAYIVGSANGSMDKIQTSNFSGDTNIVIADQQNEADKSKLVPVQLPSGAIRTEWGLKANPGKLGKQVLIQANLENYFSVPGLKSPTSIVEVAK
ncbi:DUF6359 domain-containing protein [Bacteroides acidifaciens]|uniref:DUF6359 domain-containing protein n=1 Tax=Bacteroides acidifaciens TaxID=85831 RepID=UPI00242FF298|nr:DUF6359 domain-containing protein [Bacteroides acidifaciens]